MKHESNDFTMYTAGTGFDATGKTLIISSHGGATGTDFTPAYPAVVSYGSPKGGALSADLRAVIRGDVTESQISLGGKKRMDNYELTHFEYDPGGDIIEFMLETYKGNNSDVLTINPNHTETLSNIIWQLNQWDLKYPGILCIFCRVTGSSTDFSYSGKKSATSKQANQHRINATALMFELRQKGLTT